MPTQPPPTTFYLLRGLARETRHWFDFPEKIDRFSESFKVIFLEIPGAGALRNSKAPLTIADHVTRIRKQFVDHADPSCRKIIIGLSLGGMIAAHWVDLYPDDFQAAVLINSSCSSSPMHKRLLPSAALSLLGAALSSNPYSKEKKIADRICNIEDTHNIAVRWQKIRVRAPISIGNILRQLFAAATFSLPRKPQIPTLILCSDKDRLVSPSCSHIIAEKWQSELFNHPIAGHDLPTDDPDWCIDHLVSWLKNICLNVS